MIASMHLETGIRNHFSYLKRSFATPPFKVADITEGAEPVVQVMLMSTSPGVLDGDRYCMHIDVGAGSALRMHTQGYQRLFTMQGHATQEMLVHVQAGAAFYYIPHPAVPHKHADFYTRNTVYLQDNAVLCWGEVLACGRKGNEELFQYTRYHSTTTIYLNDRLVMKENLLLEPGIAPVSGLGGLENYTHMASLVYLDQHADIPATKARLYDWLARQAGIEYGISTAPVNGLTLRLLGYKAEQLFDCLKEADRLIRE